ncbi:tyrosine-type recombinase/integrase [Salmonirosea aquatica]
MAVSVRTELNSRANADGTHTVLIRYTAQRKPKREATAVHILKKDYNPRASFVKANWVRASCPHAADFNRILRDRIRFIMGVIETMEKTGGVDVAKLQNELTRLDGGGKEQAQGRPCFIAFFRDEIERLSQNQRRYALNYLANYNKLREFAGEKLYFDELTVKFVKDYYAWELKRNGVGTVNKSISRMWGIYNQAVREGVVEKANPFGLLTRKKAAKVNRRRLTFAEIKLLADLQIDPTQKGSMIRDVFLTQFYVHGMRVGDAMLLRVGNFQRAGGRMVLSYKTEKTDAALVGIELSPQAEIIVAPYLDGKRPDQFVFPFLDDDKDYSDAYFLKRQIEAKVAYYNKIIKRLARRAGIEKPEEISSHVARHSFADLARKSGASVYDISKGLRHSSISITEMYLSSFDDRAVNSLNNIYQSKDDEA